MSGSDSEQIVQNITQAAPYEVAAFTELYDQAGELYRNYAPEFFPQSRVAPLSNDTVSAIEGLRAMPGSELSRDVLESNQNLVRTGGVDVNSFGGAQRGREMFGVATPGDNPITAELADRVTGENVLQFQRSVMPRLRGNQVASNTYGGTRGALAEGIAAGELARVNANTRANIYQTQLNEDRRLNLASGQLGGQLEGQDAQYGLASDQFRAMYLPQALEIQRANLAPLIAAGDFDRAFRQQVLNDEIGRWDFYQNQPYDALDRYMRTLQGVPSGGQSNVSTSPGPSSGGFAGAAGGAASGAVLGSYFGPWGTALGAIGGGIGGYFS